jgi:hypothetical protein
MPTALFATSLVPPPGLEPGTTVPKTVVISVSLQGHVVRTSDNTTAELGERLYTY